MPVVLVVLLIILLLFELPSTEEGVEVMVDRFRLRNIADSVLLPLPRCVILTNLVRFVAIFSDRICCTTPDSRLRVPARLMELLLKDIAFLLLVRVLVTVDNALSGADALLSERA